MIPLSQSKTGGLWRASGFFIPWLVLALATNSLAQTGWSLNASLSFNSGRYIYQQTTSNYYLTGGLRYGGVNWSLAASVPVILQNSAVYESGSSGYDPENHRMTDRTATQTAANYSGGIGDVYLYGEYRLLNPLEAGPALYINAQIKLPTADRLTLFSTGEFDYGAGVRLRQWFGSVNIFADAGYLNTGDPAGFTYQNPFNYGLGISTFFAKGSYSASFYFKGYTEIISGLEPPREIALGLFRKLPAQILVSFYLSKGLSESSPDIALSSGIDWKF